MRLNWDRTQYFLVLNLAVIAAATGLLKLGAAEPLKYTVALLFWGGMIMAALGVRVIRRGHNYYRATRYQKAALEGLLYLLTPTEVPPWAVDPPVHCHHSRHARGLRPFGPARPMG